MSSRLFTAWAIMVATMVSSRRSWSRSRSRCRRSTRACRWSVVDLDGHADEGDLVLLPGPRERVRFRKRGSWLTTGHHHGLAGVHHPAGDAFAQLVAAPLAGLGGEAVGHLDLQLRGLGVEDGDGAPAHAHELGQDLQNLLQAAGQGAGRAQGLGNFIKQG